MEFKQETGKRLKAIRIARNLTLSNVCESIGIYNNGLGPIEKGERSCSIHTLIKLCKFYGVSPSNILGLENIVWEIEPNWASLIKEMQLRNLSPRQVFKNVEKDLKRVEYFEIEIIENNK